MCLQFAVCTTIYQVSKCDVALNRMSKKIQRARPNFFFVARAYYIIQPIKYYYNNIGRIFMGEWSRVKTQKKRRQNYYSFREVTTSCHRNFGKVGSSTCRWLLTHSWTKYQKTRQKGDLKKSWNRLFMLMPTPKVHTIKLTIIFSFFEIGFQKMKK